MTTYIHMSAQICKERSEYYRLLEWTEKGTLDITPWIAWFLDCLGRAFESAEGALAGVLSKARFWEKHRSVLLNERQHLMLNKVLDDFEGKLTASKWAKIAKCSPDTALRDIEALIERDILLKDTAGGRSTSYSLVRDDLPLHERLDPLA